MFVLSSAASAPLRKSSLLAVLSGLGACHCESHQSELDTGRAVPAALVSACDTTRHHRYLRGRLVGLSNMPVGRLLRYTQMTRCTAVR